jgi:hypothetical protein
MSLHKEFFGFIFLFFIAWVFLAGNPSERIEHACQPVGWVGNATVSLATLVVPKQQERLQGWFDKVEYGCRYVTWRLVYQDTYNKWLASQNGQPDKTEQAQPQASTFAASAPVAAPEASPPKEGGAK